MAGCFQKVPSGNESRAEGENDEMGIPNYREISRLKSLSKTTTKKLYPAKKCEANIRANA